MFDAHVELSSSFALLAFLAAGLVWVSAAVAAYPGENGKIFFQSCGVGGCSHYNVYSVNPDGTELRNLTEALTAPEGPPDDAFDPSVSADGKRVAFGVDSQATAEIWVMNADGSEPHQLTNDNLLDQEPTISPDGSRIAWNQWSPFPGYTDRDIWVMNADGSGQQLLFNGFGTETFSQFTPDGQTLVMASETGDMDIRKIPSTPAVPPLTEATAVAADDELLESEPTVSPDGTRVAFTQVPKSTPFSPFDIYSVGIEGGATTPVYATAADERFPTYSPDGAKMVFDSDEVPMVGNADGSGTPVPLEIGGLVGVAAFDWAPKQVAATSSGPPGPSGKVPNGRIGKHPKKRSRQRLARFTFFSNLSDSSFECKLDRKPFRHCTSPFRRKVKLGRHRFQLRAVAPDDTRDPTPAIYRWTVLPR
jgi:TolB protein